MDTMTRPTTLSASSLINEPVHNLQNERIGKIEDYMIDLKGGCIEYAVLSFGGFLGFGGKMFAIPWNSMELDTDRHAWILDVTEDRLKQAPGFDKDNWPDLSNTDYRNSITAYWAANAQSGYRGVRGPEGSGGEGGQGGMGGMGGMGGGYGQGSEGGGYGQGTTSGQQGGYGQGMTSSQQGGDYQGRTTSQNPGMQQDVQNQPGLQGGRMRMEDEEDTSASSDATSRDYGDYGDRGRGSDNI